MVTRMFNFLRSILMESTKLSTWLRDDQRSTFVYRDVGPLSSLRSNLLVVLLGVVGLVLLLFSQRLRQHVRLWVARHFRLEAEAGALRVLLMAGMAAGFGAVFGTPLAGAVFALEVLAVGRLHHAVLLPCLVAALLADRVALLWAVWLNCDRHRGLAYENPL